MCHVLEVSKSGYYAWRSRNCCRRENETRQLVKEVQAIYEEHNGRYGSPRITYELRARGYVSSMNRQGCCYDNAVMESFFHTLKMEHIYWERFETKDIAMLRLFEYIELYYNSYRRHSYLGFKSPLEFETAARVS